MFKIFQNKFFICFSFLIFLLLFGLRFKRIALACWDVATGGGGDDGGGGTASAACGSCGCSSAGCGGE